MNAENKQERRSTSELEELKKSWSRDPIWDIEDTKGFEAHREELLEHRRRVEAEQEQALMTAWLAVQAGRTTQVWAVALGGAAASGLSPADAIGYADAVVMLMAEQERHAGELHRKNSEREAREATKVPEV